MKLPNIITLVRLGLAPVFVFFFTRDTGWGYASALAWVTFTVMMVITVLLFRSSRKWVYFPEEDENAEI